MIKYLLLLLPAIAIAGGNQNSNQTINNTTTNNYSEQFLTITNGASEGDLAAGLAAAFANNHQFDYVTTDYQASIVGAWETGQDENAVSFGLAKRFEKADVLFHTSYTYSSSHYLTIGGTFRF